MALVYKYQLSDLEVVIQDNSSDNTDFKKFISGRKIENIKYFYTAESIPISSNVDLAIKHSTGEYICVIGDDDGFLPNIVECAKWMKKNNIDAMTPALTTYNWPNFNYISLGRRRGELRHKKFSYNVTKKDVRTELKQLARRGFTHIQTIPKFYHGIVNRKCADEVYEIGGKFCPGPSPDMASAVALCFTVKKFVTIDLPVIIVGQGEFVGGGEYKLKGGVKDIKNVPHLPKNAKEEWSKQIPRVWCSETVWPESAIKALEYMGKKDEIYVDYEFIIAKFIYLHSKSYKLAIGLCTRRVFCAFYLSYFIVSGFYYRAQGILLKIIKKSFSKDFSKYNKKEDNLESIAEASDWIQKNYTTYSEARAVAKLEFRENSRFEKYESRPN
jgi:glycosyltransferase involved in cell wall biosynthesis